MSVQKLRVGYVPEHFSTPILWLGEKDSGIELHSCPSGTGQMIQALKEDKIDVAVALTESLIAGIVRKAADYRIVGQYVSSPLNWAVITGKDTPYKSIADLRGKTIGVSRMGSGSQIFASYMALREKWFADANAQTVEPLDFKVLDTFKGLRDGVNNGEAAAFLWEWFTTKPYVDSGECRFIGNVPTPWPSWAIVAKPETNKDIVKGFLERLDGEVQDFNSKDSRENGKDIEYIKKSLGYPEEDIKEWLKITDYPKNIGEVQHSVIFDTLEILEKSGVVQAPEGGWKLDTFVDPEIAKVI
ncbi:periplasmic binding protein-like II [Cystobasidium minutum MCA 4210]|uniref:periplasmic binding protein-like II n=1 Tax=Cystobasidium minutum MCA 4210 TaxID=1397322 RepID=UPI0034D0036B|eukprot:jgi/Rhomi1/198435/gm1.6649_g